MNHGSDVDSWVVGRAKAEREMGNDQTLHFVAVSGTLGGVGE